MQGLGVLALTRTLILQQKLTAYLSALDFLKFEFENLSLMNWIFCLV